MTTLITAAKETSETIHMEISSAYWFIFKQTKPFFVREACTKTRFETEAQRPVDNTRQAQTERLAILHI